MGKRRSSWLWAIPMLNGGREWLFYYGVQDGLWLEKWLAHTSIRSRGFQNRFGICLQGILCPPECQKGSLIRSIRQRPALTSPIPNTASLSKPLMTSLSFLCADTWLLSDVTLVSLCMCKFLPLAEWMFRHCEMLKFMHEKLHGRRQSRFRYCGRKRARLVVYPRPHRRLPRYPRRKTSVPTNCHCR